MSRRTLAGWIGLLAPPVLAVASIIAGVVLGSSTSASFGWVAYAPLSDTAFAPGQPAARIGALVLILLGVALLAGWVGFLLGRRPRG